MSKRYQKELRIKWKNILRCFSFTFKSSTWHWIYFIMVYSLNKIMFFGCIFFKCCSSADTLFVFNHLWLKLPKKVCTTSYWNFLDTLYWNPYRSYLHLHLIYEMAQNEETRKETIARLLLLYSFQGTTFMRQIPKSLQRFIWVIALWMGFSS